MRKITAITAFLSLCAVFIFSVTTISTAEEPVLETKVIPLHIASVNYEPTEDISVMNMKDTEKKEELLPDEDIALIAVTSSRKEYNIIVCSTRFLTVWTPNIFPIQLTM